MSRPEDVQATFCATLVDEWARAGVEHAVVSPGSRSTPLALALAADERITLHVHHDERSAGFLAVGLSLAGWEPALVLTTSGTAAVELHPAVVEADLAGVPLLVCTADRPSELIDVRAPQAIDQAHLFGRAPRWFHAPGVADEGSRGHWRALAARAYAEASGPRPGPVHLNLAFREPLLGNVGELPPGRPVDGATWTWRPPMQGTSDPVISVEEDLMGRRGVFVAGAGSGDGALLHAIATALGWPVLASPQADVWSVPGAVIPAADAILRVSDRADLAPEVVVRLGGGLASRVVGEWIATSAVTEVVVDGIGSWNDPHATASVVVAADPDQLLASWADALREVAPVDGGGWRAAWEEAGSAAMRAIDAVLHGQDGLSEPAVARAVVDALPDDAILVASSSMPIRDLEWYVQPSTRLRVHANRGANGIDGVVSTAVGVALASRSPTALLIGDVAFLHDSNGLLGAAGRGIDLVVVVLDNDGGGIFSLLPQADALATPLFEKLYGTPHGLDLVALAAAHGVAAAAVDDVGSAMASAFAAGGVHVLVIRSDRASNADLHRRLNRAVAEVIAAH